MPQCIAFHSYKGGTGKTTIACNLAAMLSFKGYNVSLLDLDVYAPSLHAYFEYNPDKWINDLLFENSDLHDIMADMTPALTKYAANGTNKKLGRLLVGFSNPQKEEIYKLEGSIKSPNANIQLLRRFVQLREDLISDYESDYVILDTSPGIRYAKYNNNNNNNSISQAPEESPIELGVIEHQLSSDTFLTDQTRMEMISTIPCYCDIQFKKKEFLTVLQYPDHPFAKQLERLATTGQIKV